MTLVKFIFSNFWYFTGTIILLSVIYDEVKDIIDKIKKSK